MKLKVFVGWSGQRSQEVALILKEWLPKVLPAADPWVSTEMDKGIRWIMALSDELAERSFGIVCVTPENIREPWISFEAGALSRVVTESRVCPYLFDLDVSNLTGPLAQFNAVKANKEDTLQLLLTMNKECGNDSRKENDLEEAFNDLYWEMLESQLNEVQPVEEIETPQRTTNEMIKELIGLTRQVTRDLGFVRAHPLLSAYEDDELRPYAPPPFAKIGDWQQWIMGDRKRSRAQGYHDTRPHDKHDATEKNDP